MKNSLSMAGETEAQRDQMIYQIHGILEVGFKPQSPPLRHRVVLSENACWGTGYGVGEVYGIPTTQTVRGALDRARGRVYQLHP